MEMRKNRIDEADLVGANVPEFFIDDIVVQKILRGECLRIYCGTWNTRLFVPQYSAVIPATCILHMGRKLFAADTDQVMSFDQRLLM